MWEEAVGAVAVAVVVAFPGLPTLPRTLGLGFEIGGLLRDGRMLEGARALAAAVGAAKEGTAREVAFGCGWEDRAEAAVLEVRVEGALFIVGAEFLTGGFDLGRAREDSGADCFLVWVDAAVSYTHLRAHET